MRFGILLCIVSLALVVPVFFILKEKSRRNKINHVAKHRQYLEAQQQKNQMAQQTEQATTVDKLALQHLPIEQLPKHFQKVLLEIESVCFALNKKNVANQKWFSIKRVIDKHLPELLANYLSVSTEYANTHIVDKSNQQTTQDVVFTQLKSILNFLKANNHEADNLKIDDILATRNYLASLYDNNGINPDFMQQKHRPSLADLTADTCSKEYMQYGYHYVYDCYQGNNQCLTQALIYKLGQVVFLSDNTLLYYDQLTKDNKCLASFDTIVTHCIPQLINQLAQYNDTTGLEKRLLETYQNTIITQLDTVVTLLKNITRLLQEKVISYEQVTESAQQAQKLIDDDFWLITSVTSDIS